MHSDDRRGAIDKMKALLSSPFLVLDTETTGLDRNAEIVSIALIDHESNVLLDTYVKPNMPIDEDGEAFRINGIGQKAVEQAPTFEILWPILLAMIVGKVACIYNAPFDVRMLEQARKAYNFSPPGNVVEFVDIMLPYSVYVGDWSDYFDNYRYQKLPGGGHSALDDCRATLALIKRMAATPIAVEAE